MSVVKLQLNTPVEITRDLRVEVVDQVTGRKVDATPFLDGTVNVRDVDPGSYRVTVKHPNLPFAVLDRPIRVLPDRPTFVPLQIDLNLFQNTPVRDIPEMDLAPVRDQLDGASGAADRQAGKRGGEPIYADDWNALAGTVSQVAMATVDLTRRVSPHGHDHPELIEKLDEIQRNLQRFLEVFGRSMAHLQRQMQQLALQQRAESALDRIPDVTPEARREVDGLLTRLEDARHENPYLYLRELRRTGEAITNVVADLLPPDEPDVANAAEVTALLATTTAMSEAMPASSYQDEVQLHLRVDQRTPGGTVATILKGGSR